MEKAREKMLEQAKGDLAAEAACFFPGFSEGATATAQEKAGHGSNPQLCRELIAKALVALDNSPAHREQEFERRKIGDQQFIAVSGYLYVTDFTKWLLKALGRREHEYDMFPFGERYVSFCFVQNILSQFYDHLTRAEEKKDLDWVERSALYRKCF